MKPKISVIIPVYNVEKYIEKCLESLFNQTYENLELIIVNDCSTDESDKIIRKKIKDHKNVIYFSNKKNSGLAYTRNVGLEKATGDYIGYIDSDDYIPNNYYECLLNTLIKEKADIAICDINIVYEKEMQSQRVTCGAKNSKKIDFVNTGEVASACNKLFKRKNIEEYKFAVGKVNEDIAVVIPTIIKANKVVYNEDTYYNYVQRESSIQNSSFSEKRFDIFEGVAQTLERIKGVDNYEEYKNAIVYQQLILLFIYVIPKEQNFFKRVKWLKRFNELSKKYNIRQNHFFWNFLDRSGKKHKYYYKLLVKLNCNGLSFFTSLLISMHNTYKKLYIKPVIENNITINTLIELSKKQANMKEYQVSISVVVPNYNYERFMYQRLYSILNQQVKLNEIIILDDCSTDNSRELIDDIVNKLSKYIEIKKVYNEENSGSAFKQWQKGFELAKSDYVWIAEADDYCDKSFLKKITKPIIGNKNIIISYSDTAFIDAIGNIILKTIKPEIDIMKTGHWNQNYTNNGKDEFNNYTFLNCTIANVSSAIIKKGNYTKYFKLSSKYKQAGDWLLYSNIMQLGDISFYNKTLNYYRVHGNNVSSVTKKEAHIKEIKSIHDYYDKTYGLNKKQKKEIEKRYKFLKKVWNIDK